MVDWMFIRCISGLVTPPRRTRTRTRAHAHTTTTQPPPPSQIHNSECNQFAAEEEGRIRALQFEEEQLVTQAEGT
jgi:hypothetical protein